MNEPALRQAAGRSARAAGLLPEQGLKALHQRYLLEGRALIRKNETPVKRISRAGPGPFRAVYEAKAHVDFSGWVRVGDTAVPVDLEVKTTSAPRIELGEVSALQAAQLGATAAAGGLAFVLVSIGGTWWLVPWHAWRAPASEPFRKSLIPAHLDEVGVRLPAGFVPDWLPAISALVQNGVHR